MKVIKRIRRQTPLQKIKRFFSQMGIASKVILSLYTIVSIILFFTTSPSQSSLLRFFYMRLTEILFFVIVGISDLKREEEKGSFYLIVSFLIKNILSIAALLIICSLVENWPTFAILTQTAVPIQFLFIIMVEGAFQDPQELKYLFLEPFQIKAKFYPIFIFILLMIASIRVDLIVPFFLALAFHFGKVNTGLMLISQALNKKCLNEKLIEVGFIKEISKEEKAKHLDELATNDSIFLDEK